MELVSAIMKANFDNKSVESPEYQGQCDEQSETNRLWAVSRRF